jgi:hypothetical protein
MTFVPFTWTRRQDAGAENADRTGIGGWALVIILLLLLLGAGAVGYVGWTLSSVQVPIYGYVAMAFGVIFSLVCGVGLMALVFYSSRHGYDEPAVLIPEPDEGSDPETRLEKKN